METAILCKVSEYINDYIAGLLMPNTEDVT